LSVCRSTNRAYSLLLAALLAIAATGWTVSYFETRSRTNTDGYGYYWMHSQNDRWWLDDHWISDLDDWTNPPQTWWRLMISSDQLRSEGDGLTLLPLGPSGSRFDLDLKNAFGWDWHFVTVIAYFTLGELLRGLSARVFQREGARA